VIPTMILFGLLFGRWWKSALVAAALLWPALLWVDGVITTPGEIAGAAVLALLNSAVGVGVHQLVLGLIRLARHHWPRTAAAGK
jgi:hypothetical protein